LSRAEFVTVIHNLSESITLDNIRIVVQFLDDRNTGKVSIFEFLKIILEILNQQIGGGVYAFMQVQPIIQKIINELSIDCDKFFDEIADKNEVWIEQ
jgi:Ca2+-binding EF-hand superfamily protein